MRQKGYHRANSFTAAVDQMRGDFGQGLLPRADRPQKRFFHQIEFSGDRRERIGLVGAQWNPLGSVRRQRRLGAQCFDFGLVNQIRSVGPPKASAKMS
jgi:hypothetical protein